MERATFSTKILFDSDSIIDVRAPLEFAKGHIPHAQNIPLLTDAHRHDVGILYKKEGASAATQLGIELFANRCEQVTSELANVFENDKRRVSLYCWRGGQRSRAMSVLARACGWSTEIVPGGYKAYRRWVLEEIERLSLSPLVVLVGRTGVGKTQLIQSIGNRIPTLDLQSYAGHRGSAFGGLGLENKVVGQQQFENRLATAFAKLPEIGPILVEYETALGQAFIPSSLRFAMQRAPKIEIRDSLENRVERIVGQYWQPEFHEQIGNQVKRALEMLAKHLSRELRTELWNCYQSGKISEFVEILLSERYDQSYDKELKRLSTPATAVIDRLGKQELETVDSIVHSVVEMKPRGTA